MKLLMRELVASIMVFTVASFAFSMILGFYITKQLEDD